ncbi:MAG: hypothetical protein WCL47_04790 [Holophagaceae bacterium]
MGWDGRKERRGAGASVASDSRGGLWSLPGGNRLPNALDQAVLVVGDQNHPARLRDSDLEQPEAFHTRLKAWLLQQS